MNKLEPKKKASIIKYILKGKGLESELRTEELALSIAK